MKRLGALATAILVAAMMALFAASAAAVSPSERDCEAQGGTFTRVQGEVTCVIVEEGKNPKFGEEETTTGRGNVGNKTETTTECDRPGSTEKCPPGQF